MLLGYFLHLENWTKDKEVAAVGWKLFAGETLCVKPEVSFRKPSGL